MNIEEILQKLVDRNLKFIPDRMNLLNLLVSRINKNNAILVLKFWKFRNNNFTNSENYDMNLNILECLSSLSTEIIGNNILFVENFILEFLEDKDDAIRSRAVEATRCLPKYRSKIILEESLKTEKHNDVIQSIQDELENLNKEYKMNGSLKMEDLNEALKIIDSVEKNRTKSDHQKRVEELMVKAGQDTPQSPIMPSKDIRLLRAKLVIEEALELIQGLGFGFKDKTDSASDIIEAKKLTEVFNLVESGEPDFTEIIDGCADVVVVTTGTAIACGVVLEPVLKLVDENNLEKFGPGGYRRDDGKWIKPPNHKKPDIKGELEKQGLKI